MKYTEKLKLPIKNTNFFLNKININKTEVNNFKKKIFINLDSHHNQNNWNINNFIKIIKKILLHDAKIFINFSPSKLFFLDLLPKEIISSKKILFTNKKSISEIIEIINSCEYIVSNESGPVCLGAALKKEVHSIYIPIHTAPESKIISDKIHYYNADEENDETIISNVLDRILN